MSEASSASVIVEWNQLAYDVAFAEDQFRTFKGQRALAMMHLAQHDALNSIAPRFESYVFHHDAAKAHAQAAAAQAARDVLIDQYPTAHAQIDALLEQQLGDFVASTHKSLGVKLGKAAAAAILKARIQDRMGGAGRLRVCESRLALIKPRRNGEVSSCTRDSRMRSRSC